jgi:hypothetical protein
MEIQQYILVYIIYYGLQMYVHTTLNVMFTSEKLLKFEQFI